MKQRFYYWGSLFIILFLAENLKGQVIDKNSWIPNGPVFATEQHGNIMYVGGAFDKVGKAAPYGLLLDAVTGTPNYASPALDGGVSTVLADNQGGFFIAGGFQHIGGIARNGLAYMKADGTISSFNPAFPATSTRRLLAVSSNHVFMDVEWYDAQKRPFFLIYCLDYSGNLVWSKQTDNMIFGAAVSGVTLFITGRFTVADGAPRNEIAAFNESDGTLLSWDPGNVLPKIFSNAKLAVSNSELYICYAPFSGKDVVTSFDLTTGQHSSFSVSAMSFRDILVYQGKMYATGRGIMYGGNPQPNGLIVLDTQTKNVVSSPIGVSVNSGIIYGLSADGNSIFLSGDSFIDSNSITLGDAIALDATTQAVLPFSASVIKNYQKTINPANYIFSIAAGGGKVFAGGSFVSITSQSRNNLFAYDITTGGLLPFAPNMNGSLSSLHVTSSKLYLTGNFDVIDQQTGLNGLASIDLSTGIVDNWSPVFDYGNVPSILPPTKLTGDANAVYLTGNFMSVNGISRNGVASFDDSGSLTNWTPSGITGADAIITSGTTICVAAWTANGNMISFFDASGQALHVGIPYQGTVYDMAVDNGILFIGGNFTSVGGQLRSGIAAVDINTGTLVANWNPVLQASGLPIVNCLAAGGGTVYVSGNFNSVNSVSRYQIAALDESTGQTTNWNLIFDNLYSNPLISSLYCTPNNVYIGGDFQGIDQEQISYLAAFSPDHSNVVTGTVYYDLNSNGAFDSGDNVASNILMEVQPLNLYYPTDANGKYKAFVGNGNFTIQPVSPSPAYTISVTPGNRSFTFASDLQVSNNNDFAIKLQQNVVDMAVVTTNTTSARPGFPLNYSIDYKNVGTAASSGLLTVTLDPAIQFNSSTPAPSAVNGNTLTWNYALLDPGTGVTIKLDMVLPPNVFLLGKDLVTVATVTPSTNDNNNTDNTFTLHQTVVGSYDPNDKQVSPQGQGDAGYVAANTNEFIYTIRFQNKGNADAINIKVIDQLDANLNVLSFKMVSASHPYTYQILDGVVKWDFTNVNLPYEGEYNPDQSNGYITYSVAPKANLAPGVTIQNTASIYFDYNPAVVTNTVTNTISNKTPQVIQFAPIATPLTYATNLTVSLNALGGASGNPVTFTSSDDNVASIVNGNTLKINGAGPVDIYASQLGDNTTYLDATPVKQTIQILPQPQVIAFASIPGKVFGDEPFALTVTGGGSGNAITFSSSDTKVATVDDAGMVTIIGAGSADITADQSGNNNYLDAASVKQPLQVAPQAQVIAGFNIPAKKVFGDQPFPLSATGGGSGNPVVFSSSNDQVAKIVNGTVTITGAGTVDISASQAGDNHNYQDAASIKQTLLVDKAAQKIMNFGALGTVIVGDQPITLHAVTDSGLPVKYSSSNSNVTISGNVGTILSSGVTTITAQQDGNANYLATSANQTLWVNDSKVLQATSSLDFGDHLVGDQPTTKSLTVTNTGSGPLTISNISVPAGYTIDKTNAVVPSNGTLTLNVTFMPQTSQDYAGNLTITSDATSGTGTVELKGSGSVIAGVGDERGYVSAYPNPSKGVFTLELNDCDGGGEVKDESGRGHSVLLQEVRKGVYQLDLSDQSDGVYLFLYYSHGEKRVIRMVKKG